jgi:hypothetical protein
MSTAQGVDPLLALELRDSAPLARSVRGLQVSNVATLNFPIDDFPAEIKAMGNRLIAGLERVGSAEVLFARFATFMVGNVDVE